MWTANSDYSIYVIVYKNRKQLTAKYYTYLILAIHIIKLL